MRLAVPTDDGAALAAGAAALMRRHWDRARPVRLLGVRVAGLQRGDEAQLTLLGAGTD